MKARLKHTNQIINVERDPLGWSWESPKGNVLLDTEELIFLDDNFDWQSFRAEAALRIFCAKISRGVLAWTDVDIDGAIETTDKFIAKLKEKEE